MRLRQIALVAHELDPTIDALRAELGADVCFVDPGVGAFGLHNALLPLGDTFLEVVAPIEDRTAAGRYLERRGGDGGYMVLLQLDEDERAACRANADEIGIREVSQPEDTHGDVHIVGTHFHPADHGGAILSVDTATPVGSWGWAGDGWQPVVRTERAGRILAAELQGPDPEAMAARWGALLGLEPIDGIIAMDQSELRFVELGDERGEGLTAIEVEAIDPLLEGRSVEVAGIRIDWVSPTA
ncbi:MAG: hypothetical protein ACI8Y4_004677 [Candidatus Poriferisodalaceae bacterium]|jgi:hypothetical protein